MDKQGQEIVHGTALEIFGYGVVITGNSGSGKSELALKLIDRQHKYIADDLVSIKQDDNNKLWLTPCKTPFVHLGGIGFVNLAEIYGNHVTVGKLTRCNLFIELENSSMDNIDRVVGSSTSINILDQKIPSVKLFIAQNRPLELLVEILVRKQQQLDNGYDDNQTFIDTISQK
ncbi:MAG TPA: hypothetical protein VKR58_11620 [Aquella sp.]|nr:hypothetical protein [Aquella sp.]